MPDMIQSKLGAYLDGELSERSRLEVETHLVSCPDCQQELESLRQLSYLLHTAPQPEFSPPQQFKSQVMLLLSSKMESRNPGMSSQQLYWLAPAVAIAGWFFLQVTLNLSGWLSLVNRAGLLDGAATWLNSNPLQTTWFSVTQSTLGGMLNPTWQSGLWVLNGINLFMQNLLVIFLLQLGAGLLYWVSLLLVARKRGLPGLVLSSGGQTSLEG